MRELINELINLVKGELEEGIKERVKEKNRQNQLNRILDDLCVQLSDTMVQDMNLETDIDIYGLVTFLKNDTQEIKEQIVIEIDKNKQKNKTQVLIDRAAESIGAVGVAQKNEIKRFVDAYLLIMRKFYEGMISFSDKFKIEVLVNNLSMQIEDTLKKFAEEYRKESEDNSSDIYIKDSFAEEGEDFYRFSRIKGEMSSVENSFLSEIYSVYGIDETYREKLIFESIKDREILFQKLLEILSQQKILLIVGDYGSGKTILLKALHQALSEQAGNVVFTTMCRSLAPYIMAGKKNEMFSFLDQQGNKGKCFYVLLDALDDLNLPMNCRTSYLEICIEWMIEYFKKRENCYLIVDSRNYIKIGSQRKESIQEYFAADYLINYEQDIYYFIATRKLNNSEIDIWIQNYSAIRDQFTDRALIKREFGKLMKSLSNPLFLFIFMRKYIKDGVGKETGYYYFYMEFVRQTILGKYQWEVSKGAFVLQQMDFVDQYEEFLENVAFDILRKNNSEIQVLIENIWSDEILLGEQMNNRNFFIRLDEFSKFTETQLHEFQSRGMETANLLNCYFIGKANEYVFFKDVNVLFLLASQKIYESMMDMISRKQSVFDSEDLEKLQMIDFYPQVIDFVIYQIMQQGRKEDFFRYAYDAIKKNPVKDKLISGNTEKLVPSILFIYIIFIKTNVTGYNTPEMRHIFKDIVHYAKLYKEIRYRKDKNKPYIYSIERYFMNIYMNDAILKRLNLKYFNFQGSKMNNTRFIQCLFGDNNLKYISTGSLTFELCRIYKVQMNSLSGDSKVDIVDCQVRDSDFDGVKELSFRRTELFNVKIGLAQREVVRMQGCVIDALHIKNLEGDNVVRMEISECIFHNPVSLANMKGRIQIRGGCMKTFPGNLFKNTEHVNIEGKERIYG